MKKILIIEDSEVIRESTAEFLIEEGYEVYKAENGMAGVRFAYEYLPDIILCDIFMPKLDGYGVLGKIKENRQTESIPFIFLTGKTEKRDIEKGVEMGVTNYMTKPIDYVLLLDVIEKLTYSAGVNICFRKTIN